MTEKQETYSWEVLLSDNSIGRFPLASLSVSEVKAEAEKAWPELRVIEVVPLFDTDKTPIEK